MAKSGFWKYLWISVFCFIFGRVYESFSHGVESAYMMQFWLIPVILGIVPCLLSAFFPSSPRLVRKLWVAGMETLIAGTVLAGIFEIYGTTNQYVRWYWIVGGILLAVAAVFYLLSCVWRKKKA